MKILLLVAQHGFSFVNQANYLSRGLIEIGIENSLVRVDEEFKNEALKVFSPDIVLGVGSWRSYREFIEIPRMLGLISIPWIVSDEEINEYKDEYNKLDLILTTSNFSRNVFIRDGIRQDLLKVLPEAVDDKFWHPLLAGKFRDFINLVSIQDDFVKLPFKFDLWKIKEEKIPILFTTGGDATNKGAQEVIRALGEIDKRGNKKWIYIIKTWPSAESFEKSSEELRLAESLGILENIRYIVGEFSSEFLLYLMNLCDIYVAPSRIEGFGLPHVEAALCEKPVVGLEGTATEETVVDAKTGFLSRGNTKDKISIANVSHLTEILEKLISDKDLRIRLGKNARIHAISKFSPKNVATRLVEIITPFLK